MPVSRHQLTLFPPPSAPAPERNVSTFTDNMRRPVHRWFRYSAGFSATWAEQVIAERSAQGPTRVLDPFAGSATTLLAAQDAGVASVGIESHPFVARVARAKLLRGSDPAAYRAFARDVLAAAREDDAAIDEYPPLIRKCYRDETLADLDRLRRALAAKMPQSGAEQAGGQVRSIPSSDAAMMVNDLSGPRPPLDTEAELTWLTLVGILRSTSHVGTANWQYVLPRKSKKNAAAPFDAFEQQTSIIHRDMLRSQRDGWPRAELIAGDARTCAGIADGGVNLVITSPPYPNNYDYADATRLEMCFLREIDGWGDLQQAVRRHLVRSCSQHVPERAVDLDAILAAPELAPIRDEIGDVCRQLGEVRLTKGGKKTYHLMVACYFFDLAQVWHALRRVCDAPSEVCFVIGDSAPYGVYVPVMDWLGRLAVAAGFKDFRFEKIRDRNVKWKNRKHRVPLCEGRLWVTG